MIYKIPYGNDCIAVNLPENQVLFDGKISNLPPLADLKTAIKDSVENPRGTKPLRELARGKNNIVMLVEDATRSTPLADILPVIIDYLNEAGIEDSAISFLTAPGTHRIMTEEEIEEKLGPEMVRRFDVYQHDATKSEEMVDLGVVEIDNYTIPVHVNRRAVESDLLIGFGNIVPHSDAGYSGGAKILQPGICDFVTTSATHVAAGLSPDIPLGLIEGNPCRKGMEEVARRANLAFIVNVVLNVEGKVAGIFAGDFVEAHRVGAAFSRKSFGFPITERADIVIASSSPADMDYWQAEKGIISAYFAVKENGIIIFVAPCYEGLAQNHPKFREWLALPSQEAIDRLKKYPPDNIEADLVSGVLAICNARVREKARVFCYAPNLTQKDLKALRYLSFSSVQDALDEALKCIPNATVGFIPKGGIALPFLVKSAID